MDGADAKNLQSRMVHGQQNCECILEDGLVSITLRDGLFLYIVPCIFVRARRQEVMSFESCIIFIMPPYLDRNLAIEAPFEIFRGLPLLYSIMLNENLIINNIGCVQHGIPFSNVPNTS